MHNKEHRNYLIFAIFFIIVSFFILKSFLSGMLWGSVTALSVWPFFEKIAHKEHFFSKPGVSKNAFFFATIFFLLFFIPTTYAINEMANIYLASRTYIEHNTFKGIWVPPHFIQYLPMKDKILYFWQTNIAHSANIIDLVTKIGNGQLVGFFAVLWTEIIDRIITVIVMIVSFYFMLKNGEHIQKNYKIVFTNLLGERSIPYINNSILALRGTINGVVLIGMLEGILLAIPLLFAGFGSGLAIGLVAGVLGVIPLLMPLFILPCLGYIYFSGEHTWAIIGLIDLIVVWFIFENIIKPQIISQKVKINTFIILIAMIGGLQLFGPVGLFLGPAIISMAIAMIQDFLTIPKTNFEDSDT